MAEEMKVTHDNTGWHMDKRVQVADILALFMLGAALSAWIFALGDRVTAVEGRVTTHEAVVETELRAIRHNQAQFVIDMNRHYQEILHRLERIEDGLNRHIEKTSQQQDGRD